MKKLLATIMALLMTLSFAACAKKSDPDMETLKNIWGKTPEEAVALYGKTLDEAEFHDGDQPCYELTGVKIGDKTAKVVLYPFYYRKQEETIDLGIGSVRYEIAGMTKAEAQEKFAADADYSETLSGYYTAEHYSAEEWEWIEKYTPFCRKDDACQTRMVTGTKDGTITAQGESAVIQMERFADGSSEDGSSAAIMFVYGMLPAMLAHKEEVEQFYPDGWEETVKAYWEEQNS